MEPATSDLDLHLVARALVLDRAAASAIERLRASDVASILLKGAAIGTWLYRDGALRSYTDVDLLVSPSQFERATQVLAELGYVDRMAGAHPAEVGPKERDLVRPDGAWIDLHLGLIGIPGDPQQCWDILADRVVNLRLTPDVEVQALDEPARAMHLALHAAQNGLIDLKAIEDLRRGLEIVEERQWREAALLADELGASQAFAAGLRLLPAGRSLAERLSLPHGMSVELALRVGSAPQDAIFFERLGQVRGLSHKVPVIARKLFPTAAFLRANSPMARRHRGGLVASWLGHPFGVLWRFGPAFRTWRNAKSATRRDALDRP